MQLSPDGLTLSGHSVAVIGVSPVPSFFFANTGLVSTPVREHGSVGILDKCTAARLFGG
jgi:hypothetical protein